MKKSQPIKLAFSLIELSIVILVIGILIIGITKGTQIIKNSRIQSARSLTTNSPVNSTSGLVFWLDANSPSSIATGTTTTNTFGNPVDGDNVVRWQDINSQSVEKITVSATSNTNRGVYVENGINGIPSIRFNGSSTAFESSTAPISGNNVTIFVVSQKTTITSYGYMVSQFANSSGLGGSLNSLIFYTAGATGLTYVYPGFVCSISSCVSEVTSSFSAYSVSKPTILGMSAPNASSTKFYLNSLTATGGGVSSSWNLGKGYFVIGAGVSSGSNSNWFGGLLSEIIIFNRNLSANEITNIVQYLSTKYGIK